MPATTQDTAKAPKPANVFLRISGRTRVPAKAGGLAYRMIHDRAACGCIVDAGSDGYDPHRRQRYALEGHLSTRKFNTCREGLEQG